MRKLTKSSKKKARKKSCLSSQKKLRTTPKIILLKTKMSYTVDTPVLYDNMSNLTIMSHVTSVSQEDSKTSVFLSFS